MAIGVNKLSTVIGLAEEVTEGTYQAPTDYILPLEGFSITSDKEQLERPIISANIGAKVPRTGLKTASAALPVEYKGSGTEGSAPESDLLLKSLLGTRRQVLTQSTTKAGNGVSQLEIEDADIGKYAIGDMIVILEAGDHSVVFVKSVDTTAAAANIGYVPARSGAPSDNVVISKSTTYSGANAGHVNLSVSTYWGDTILEKTIGCKAGSMSVDSFSAGQIPSLNFSLAGTDFDRIDGSSVGASFSSGLPFIALGACLYQNDLQLSLQDFSMSVTNEVSQVKDICATSGVISQRITKRDIEITYNPYLDDALSPDQFAKFNAQELYSIVVFGFNPSTTAGEVDLGSACGIYLPNVLTTSDPLSDVDNIVIDDVTAKATTGATSDLDDIFMGFV